MLSLVTPPSAELLTTAEAKTHLRVTSSAEDSYIDLLVKAARTKAENFTSQRFINQSWKLTLDGIPRAPTNARAAWWDGVREGAITEFLGDSTYIDLKLYPLVSITSFNTYDSSNTATLYGATNYFADLSNQPSRLIKSDNSSWPVNLRSRNAIEIISVFGYGATSASVPEDIRHAVRLILAHMYENRGDSDMAEVIPGLAMQLLESYKTRRLA